MQNSRRLLTPDARLVVTLPSEGSALLPAACFVEQALPEGVRYIADVWQDEARARAVAERSVELSHGLARAVVAEIHGRPDGDLVPLYLDVCNTMVELTLERMLRLADAGPMDGLWPQRIEHGHPRVARGKQFKAVSKGQAFQWLVLRLLAGARDVVTWNDASIFRRARLRLARALELRRPHAAGEGFFVAHLGRSDAFLKALGVPLAPVPDLVQPYALRLDVQTRTRLATAFAALLQPTIHEHGRGQAPGLAAVGQLFAALIPTSRLENVSENLARYESLFRTRGVRGYLTATGQGRYDECVFFMACCRRFRRPIVILQHGGQYGYDDKIPSFFSIDQGLPDVFVSWGWEAYPGSYDRTLQRARIVPLSEPKLSQLEAQGRTRKAPEGPATLLVPLSKLRTLDNRLGGNATDGVVVQLRRFVHAVIAGSQAAGFERFVVTYRSASFDADLLRPLLENVAGVEVLDARTSPVSSLLTRVHAVLWDVTATGMFETLRYGLPTVVRFQQGRWAGEARQAEQLLAANGVGAYTAEEAVASLGRFLREPAAWTAALQAVQPALDAYARTADDCDDQWRGFLGSLSAT